MFFDYLNPLHWVRTILGIILLLVLILIPGLRAVFGDKTFSETFQMLTSDFATTVGKIFSEAFNYYKSWFENDKTQATINDIKSRIIETLEKRIRGEKPEEN